MRKICLAGTAAILLAGSTAPAFAQNVDTSTTTSPAVAPVDDDDDGFDLGWLGLLGLAGLLGLRRKPERVDVTRNTSAVR